MNRPLPFLLSSSSFLLLFVLISPAQGSDEVVHSIMYRSPELPHVTQVPKFTEGLTPLWLKALARSEAESQRQAAFSIALAHRFGMKGLETTVAPLAQVLDRAEDAGVRLAIVAALVRLDARQTAPKLFQKAQSGDSDLRDLIEPALARWDYQPARAVWLERLGQPEPVLRQPSSGDPRSGTGARGRGRPSSSRAGPLAPQPGACPSRSRPRPGEHPHLRLRKRSPEPGCR